MGNIIGTFTSSFLKVIANLFGAPLDFLSGKSCSSICGSTWDVICYIENFCVSSLLRLATVLALFYIVLLFLYLLQKIGICRCVGKGLLKMCWACSASCFSCCENAFVFLWFKTKRAKHGREYNERGSSSSSRGDSEERIWRGHDARSAGCKRPLSGRTRERKRAHLERSLRPRTHGIRVGINESSMYVHQKDGRRCRKSDVSHSIRVTRTSRFVHKGNARKKPHRRP